MYLPGLRLKYPNCQTILSNRTTVFFCKANNIKLLNFGIAWFSLTPIKFQDTFMVGKWFFQTYEIHYIFSGYVQPEPTDSACYLSSA